MSDGILEAALKDVGILPLTEGEDEKEFDEKTDRWLRFLPVLKHFGNETAITEFLSWYSSSSGSYDRECSREKYVLEVFDAVIGEFVGGPEFFAWVIATGGKKGKDRWTDAIESMVEEFENDSEPMGKI